MTIELLYTCIQSLANVVVLLINLFAHFPISPFPLFMLPNLLQCQTKGSTIPQDWVLLDPIFSGGCHVIVILSHFLCSQEAGSPELRKQEAHKLITHLHGQQKKDGRQWH